MSVFIIAEAGVNHNGNPDLTFRLVDAAVSSGADAVKFQTFNAEKLVTRNAGKAAYQEQQDGRGESQLDMLKRLELGRVLHWQLVDHCRKKGIRFMSTAFDDESLHFLVADLGVDILKIPSGELTNGPFLLAHGRTGKPVLMSTGMATLDEIAEGLGALAFGYLDSGESPSRGAFADAFSSDEGQSILKKRVTLLHCTSAYPAPPGEINLLAIKVLAETFGLPVGYSDHSEGTLIPPLAVALGATVIEKHFTLDRNLPGPDHQASLLPEELVRMVQDIRLAEIVLGSGVKEPGYGECENRDVVRKSLVAARAISRGELFSTDNLAIKRPGTGRSPMAYWDLLGSQADSDFQEDEVIP